MRRRHVQYTLPVKCEPFKAGKASRAGGVWRRALVDSRATSAIEFAIVAPVFLALCIGGMYMCMMMWARGSMQEATQVAARCWAINRCASASSAQDYATSHYYGPTGAPTFTATSAVCGFSVTGALTYSWNLGLSSLDVPLNATACFPGP